MLDLFCGRFGWSKAFLERGWECVGIDLVAPPEIPKGCRFIKGNVLDITFRDAWFEIFNEYGMPELFTVDFVCASSPCEEFSVHGMKHFHPNPPYPYLGVELFEHTRALLDASGVPYVMENVRAAQHFVGRAKHHCGPFYLWGNAVPMLMAQGIKKGIDVGSSRAVKTMNKEEKRQYRAQFKWNQAWSNSKRRQRDTAKAATIPPELASCVADYAGRILEARACES